MPTKKFLAHPVLCSCYVLAATALYLYVAGPPQSPVGVLGATVLIGAVGLLVFFAAAPARYRPYGPGDALGTLAALVFSIGMAAIASSLMASAFSACVPMAWLGAVVVAVLTGAATAAARAGGDE